MKRTASALLIAFLAAGCVHGSSIDQVHAGMTHEEVVGLIGQPEVTTNTAGRECARYTVATNVSKRREKNRKKNRHK